MVKNKKEARIEKKRFELLINQVNNLTSQLVDDEIKEKWYQLKQHETELLLKKYPVELLDTMTDEKLPVQFLIDEGIKDIISVSKKHSVGSRSIENMNKIAKEFIHNYSDHIFPKLHTDNSEIQSKAKLSFIKQFLNRDERKNKIKEIKENTMPLLLEYTEQLKIIEDKDTNPFFRLLQNKKNKEEVKKAKEFIRKNKDNIDKLYSQLDGHVTFSLPDSLAIKNFNSNKEIYYQEIRNLIAYEPNTKIMSIPYYIKDYVETFKDIFFERSNDEIDKKIKDTWELVKQPLIEDELKNMSLSILNLDNDEPYSIITLNENGYRNIYDIVSAHEKKIENLGIFSKEKLAKLWQEAHEIKVSISNKIYPKFNPSKLSGNEIELLKLIYTRTEAIEHSKKLENDFETLSDDIQDGLNMIQEIGTDPYQELFQDIETIERVKQEKKDVLNYLRFLYKLEEEVNHLSDITLSNQELKQDFRNNSASYYAVLESLIGTIEGYTPSGLPDFIVTKVNEFELNITGLKGTLRPYQEFGTKYALYNKRTLLGDEMGLGKTMQAIAMINHLHQKGHTHSLVIVPLAVMVNWKREIQKWSELTVNVYHNGNYDKNREQALNDWKSHGGLLITTFDHAKRFEREDMKDLNCIVVDEAHYIKNPETQRSKIAYKLTNISEYALFMTGTPLENRVDEMQQLVSVLNSELGAQFKYQPDLYESENFKRFVSTVYLRRKRDDVLKELPDIATIEMWSDFSTVEQEYYDDAVRIGFGGLMKMRRAGFFGQSLKQSEKLQQLVDICNEAKENGHKVLVFSFFKNVLATVADHLSDRTFEIISGDVSNNRRQKIIDEFTESEPGSVLISQIQAGGVGLNIQAANIVILCEPQWKPSTENQAIGRVYRMGQTRNVIVYRLLTENSIDETMMEMLGYKSDIFDMYAKDSDVADAYDRRTKQKEVSEEQTKTQVYEVEKRRLEEKEKIKITV